MRFILSRSRRLACPYCGSGNIQRSRTKGVLESVLRSAFHIKPYRCISCDGRHYRYRPSDGNTHRVPSTSH